jgi:hypothetical protein
LGECDSTGCGASVIQIEQQTDATSVRAPRMFHRRIKDAKVSDVQDIHKDSAGRL